MVLSPSTKQLIKHCLAIAFAISLVGVVGCLTDNAFLIHASVVLLCLFVALKLKVLVRLSQERHAAQRALIEDAEQLSAVIDTQNELASKSLDAQTLMDLIVSRASALTHADGGVIELAEDDEMVYHAASGTAAAQIGLRLSTHTSLSGMCVRTGEILICTDSQTDPRVDRAACERIGLRSMVVVPLRHKQKIAGVLKIYSAKPDAFSKKQVSLLKLMSGFLGAMLDLASEVQAKRHAEQVATDASRMKSELLANMSHEIRTPINGVIGMTGLLLDTELSVQQSEFAENIRRSADSLLTLINDILDFSKIEAGKLELEELDFDLHELVHDCQKMLEFSASDKRVELLVERCPELETYIHGDPGRVRQILINLMGNAVKFTPRGRVTINVHAEPAENDKLKLRFEIRDTGIGIPESARGRMFQAFSQADSSTTRKFGGTGLGLSICKKLVDLMGGRIGVESVEGVGSLFWFEISLGLGLTIPASDKKTDTPRPELTGKLKGKRVLLAEDNPVNQRVTVLLAEKLGIRIDAVGNGQEALDALRSIPYDLILMDCQMPVLDGYEASRSIRCSERAPYQNIPIVALTANAIKGAKDRCIEAGMSDYLPKPIRQPDLVRLLEKWLTPENTAPRPAERMTAIDSKKFLDNYGDLKGHMPALLRTFLTTHVRLIQEMQEAIQTGNANLLRERAHALKGAIAQVFAVGAASLAAQLETKGRDNNLAGSAELLSELSAEIDRLKIELAALADQIEQAA